MCQTAALQPAQNICKNAEITLKIQRFCVSLGCGWVVLDSDLSVSRLLFFSPRESSIIPASVRLLLPRSSSLRWEEAMVFASFSQQFTVSLHAFRLQQVRQKDSVRNVNQAIKYHPHQLRLDTSYLHLTANYLMFSILGGKPQIGGSHTKHNEHFSDINSYSHVECGIWNWFLLQSKQ